MITVRLDSKMNVRVQDQSMPEPRESEVLVKMIACGICGSDKIVYLNSTKHVNYWGHEIIGFIISTGPRARKELKDKLVVVRTSKPCCACEICERKKFDRCRNWTRALFNGFSEYFCIQDTHVIPVGDAEPTIEHVLIEPLYVAMSLADKLNPERGDRIAIIGPGPIGLLAVFYLRLLGIADISIVGSKGNQARMKLAAKWGCKNFQDQEIMNAVSSADKIINTAPYETMARIIDCASSNCQIAFIGMSTKKRIYLDMKKWHMKNLTIHSVFPHPQLSFEKSMRLVRENARELTALISHKYNIRNAGSAFECLYYNKNEAIKIAITSDWVP